MKKLLVIISAAIMSLSITSASNADNWGVGVTAALTELDTSGTQTLKDTGGTTSTSITEDVALPELFVEYQMDSGVSFGVSYIPVQELGSKSRTDTDIATATNKASAELDNLFMFYLDYPIYENVYVKGGIQHTTIVTTENLGTGSSYDDEDVLGYTLGLGVKGDLPYGNGLFYKAEVSYTDFDEYSDSSTNGEGNKVVADTEATSVKLSVGYKF